MLNKEQKKTYINEINKYKNLAIIRSMGKAFGVAGLRVGFIVSNKINLKWIFQLKKT